MANWQGFPSWRRSLIWAVLAVIGFVIWFIAQQLTITLDGKALALDRTTLILGGALGLLVTLVIALLCVSYSASAAPLAPTTPGTTEAQDHRGQKMILVGVVFAVTALLIWLVVWAFREHFGLPTLALGGVLVLLAALLVFTTLMNVVGLSDKTQALGLPEGSVRAIIALALVGLFAILASSFLQTTSDQELTKTGLSQEQVDFFIQNNNNAKNIVQKTEEKEDATAPTTYLLEYTIPARPSDDFSKQMMTLVGTLMTAVISFYFGTMPKMPNDISRAAPELSSIQDGSRPVTTKDVDLKLSGSNLNSIRTVRLTSAGKELEGSNVLSSAGQVSCQVPNHDAFGEAGSWDVTVVDDIGRTATKRNWLTFTAALSTAAATAPAPSGISPATATAATATDFTISGTGLEGVTKIEAVPAAAGAPVPATDVKVTANQINCKLTLGAGNWTVRIAVGAAMPTSVPGEIKVA